jgi:Zn-finger nucleic acid-binding protein
MRTCPNCSEELLTFAFQAVELDTCPKCAGIWFDAGELKRLREASPEAWRKLDEAVQPGLGEVARERPGKRACPKCAGELTPYYYMYHSGIVLDECQQCGGVWVDNRELVLMSEYLDQHQEEVEEAPDRLLQGVDAQSGSIGAPQASSIQRFLRFFWSTYGFRWGRP